MRTSLFMRGIAISLLIGSLTIPTLSVAQAPSNDCSSGSGIYACDFSGDRGSVQPGFLGLDLSSPQQFFSASIGDAFFSGPCTCGLQGIVKNNGKPLKDDKAFVCSGLDDPLALAGKVTGNPNNPDRRRVKGELQVLNGNATPISYRFDCQK